MATRRSATSAASRAIPRNSRRRSCTLPQASVPEDAFYVAGADNNLLRIYRMDADGNVQHANVTLTISHYFQHLFFNNGVLHGLSTLDGKIARLPFGGTETTLITIPKSSSESIAPRVHVAANGDMVVTKFTYSPSPGNRGAYYRYSENGNLLGVHNFSRFIGYDGVFPGGSDGSLYGLLDNDSGHSLYRFSATGEFSIAATFDDYFRGIIGVIPNRPSASSPEIVNSLAVNDSDGVKRITRDGSVSVFAKYDDEVSADFEEEGASLESIEEIRPGSTTSVGEAEYFVGMAVYGGDGGFIFQVVESEEPAPTPTAPPNPTSTPNPTPVVDAPVSARTSEAKPDQPEIVGPTKIETSKKVYKIKGDAGDVPRGTYVEYKVGKNKPVKGKIKGSGKFVLKAKLTEGRNVIKMRTVTPDGQKSKFTKVKVTKE